MLATTQASGELDMQSRDGCEAGEAVSSNSGSALRQLGKLCDTLERRFAVIKDVMKKSSVMQ